MRTPAAAQQKALRKLDFASDEPGLGGLLWTRAKVAAFSREHFGVTSTLPGLSFQRPDRRAREADPGP